MGDTILGIGQGVGEGLKSPRKFDVLGFDDEDTMYVTEGHDVPREAFVDFHHSEHEDSLSGDVPRLGAIRNVYAIWEDVENPTEEGQQAFKIVPEGTPGAEPYTVCDLEWES